MKLIILIYQIISHRYHVLQTATKITKYTIGWKPLHRIVIQFSKYATTTTKNLSPPWVQWPMTIIKSRMVEKVEQHVYSQLSPLTELQPRQKNHIARREGEGGPVCTATAMSTATSSSPSSATATVGSSCMSSWGTSPVVDCTCVLLDEPTLGSTNFFWALRCFRNLASMGAWMWTNSWEGKFFNPKYFRTLWMRTRKNKPCLLYLLLRTSTMVSMKREGKQMELLVTRA